MRFLSLPEVTIQKYDSGVRRFFTVLTWLIILTGIALRIILYFQNRDLIIDEANIGRNVYERGFIGLTKPLSYEQYAPPLFMWMEKLVTLLFGFSEYALRIYPLFCGLTSLFVFRNIIKRFFKAYSLWLPVALVALTYWLTRYTTEVKQYIGDVLIVLLLLQAALDRDIFTMQRGRFILFWVVAGSVALWASMPAVFMLVAVGSYYFWQVAKKKDWMRLWPLVFIGSIWLLQFGWYYITMLKPQAESDYLQNYHHDYFLIALPKTFAEWQHNWMRLKEIICNTGGYWFWPRVCTIAFMTIGAMCMLRRNFGLFLLTVLPVGLTLIAAAFQEFSLIDRVILFMLPLNAIILGYGYDRLMRLRIFPLQVVLVGAGMYMVAHYNELKFFRERLPAPDIKQAFDYLLRQHATGKKLWIHSESKATYIYYTQIHPNRSKWQQLSGATQMSWDTDYEVAGRDVKDTVYLLHTLGFPDDVRDKIASQTAVHLRQVSYFQGRDWAGVYMYVPKTDSTTH